MHARPFLLKAHMEQDICFSIASIWKSRIYTYNTYAYQIESKNDSWEFFYPLFAMYKLVDDVVFSTYLSGDVVHVKKLLDYTIISITIRVLHIFISNVI